MPPQSEYGRRPSRGDVRPRIHPTRVIVSWVISALAILAAGWLLPNLSVAGFAGALLVAVVIAAVNAIVPPVLAAIRLPYTVAVTFLLVLAADAGALMIAGAVTEGRDPGRRLLRRARRCAPDRGGDHDPRRHRRRERRRRVLAAGHAPARATGEGPDRDGHPGDRLPRDRRPRVPGAPAGDARRQRTADGALADRWDAPDGRVGDGSLLADRREPGGDPARLERGHSRVPLGGEGARRADGVLEPGQLRRDRTAPFRGERRAARRRRSEPRQPPVRRRRPRAPHGQPDQRGEEGEPGLPRVLRERLQRHAGARPLLLGGHPRGDRIGGGRGAATFTRAATAAGSTRSCARA